MSSSETSMVENPWETYKRLLTYTRRHWVLLLLSLFGYLIYSAMNPVIAEMMQVITSTIENPTPKMVAVVCLAPLVIAFVQGLGQFIGGYSITWVGQRIVFELRRETFDHVLRLPTKHYQQSSSGRIMSKLIYDAQQVTSAGTDAITVILREGLTAIGLLGYLFYTNWKLTLILFTVGPVIGLVVNLMSKRFRRISQNIQDSMGNITQYLAEAIEGHQAVKIFSGQKQESTRFEHASNKFRSQQVKLEVSKIIGTVSVHMVISIGVGIITFLYIRLMGEDLSLGNFLAFITAVALIQKPIKQLTDVNVKIQRGITGAASIFELMDYDTERDTGTLELAKSQGDLAFENVSFSYTGDERGTALHQVSFTAKPGETVALVGRSGAGKSTIAALIPRFYDVSEGVITLDGHPIQNYRLHDLRSNIAMVTQNVVLFNDSVRNNIAYGELRDVSDEAIIQAAKDAYAWEFIQGLEHGLDTEIGEDGTQLSGGQRQRLAIARALLKDAPILILDEATSALDNESEHYIQKALERVMEGRTTLVIAHRLSTIENADKILVLDEGQIIEQGTNDSLIEQKGVYYQLHQMNFEEL